MKIYVITGFYKTDWEDHFILPKGYTSKEEADQIASSTKKINGHEVICYSTEIEVEVK